MKSRVYTILLAVLASTLFLASCDRDDDDDDNPPMDQEPAAKSVMLELEFTAGTETFDYNTVYDINGTAVQFSELRFYLSDFMLHDDDGATEMLGGAVLVDAAEDEDYSIGNTEFDHIHEVHMLLGLNETNTSADPTLAEAPLNNASMHWSWNPDGGYKFVKAEFSVDTDGDGTPDTPRSIHPATIATGRDMMIEVHEDSHGDHAHIHLTADVLDFFTDIDFTDLNGTHGSTQLTNKVTDNMSIAFSAD